MYIDKDEKDPSYPKFHWPTVEPKYSTYSDISKKYCFKCTGGGRIVGRPFCCFCEACCLALEGEGVTPLHDIPNCKRHHLSSFEGSEETITCTAAKGLANSKARQKALWSELKRVLKAGKYAVVEARVLWSTEEKVHMRPGHFWVCELGDADGKGSPVIHTFTKKNESFQLSDGRKICGDEGDCLLLIRRYYHRTVDDRTGLTFKRWQPQKSVCVGLEIATCVLPCDIGPVCNGGR